jgi:hypothetical protein
MKFCTNCWMRGSYARFAQGDDFGREQPPLRSLSCKRFGSRLLALIRRPNPMGCAA